MLNKVILMGRLTVNPELKQTPNGIAVTTFSLAVNRDYNRDITDFINIVAWRQTAEFISKYFTKGQLIVIEGSIQTSNYEDKQGNKRTVFEVIAEQVYFAGDKNEDKKSTSISTSANVDEYEEIDTDDEDLPF